MLRWAVEERRLQLLDPLTQRADSLVNKFSIERTDNILQDSKEKTTSRAPSVGSLDGLSEGVNLNCSQVSLEGPEGTEAPRSSCVAQLI